jgi:hypothetical protein
MLDTIFNLNDPNIAKAERLYGKNASLCWKISNVSGRMFLIFGAIIVLSFLAVLLLPDLRTPFATSLIMGMIFVVMVPMTAYSASLFVLSLIMKDYLWSVLIIIGFSVFFKMFRKL